MMRYPTYGSLGYRLLAVFVWRPYYWILLRQDPELRAFMIRRRIWGGEKITAERHTELAGLLRYLKDAVG